MKKIILITSLGLLTTAGVTAAVMNNGRKKTTKETIKKECKYKKSCSKAYKSAYL